MISGLSIDYHRQPSYPTLHTQARAIGAVNRQAGDSTATYPPPAGTSIITDKIVVEGADLRGGRAALSDGYSAVADLPSEHHPVTVSSE